MNKNLDIPKGFLKGVNKSFYISMIVQYYIEHKSKMEGKSMSQIVEETMLSNEDFKEVINDFFEESKL